MVNVLKLKALLVEKDKDMDFLAETMGVSKATAYRKCENPDSFTVGDVDKIGRAFELNAGQLNDIFFTQFVASNATV